MLLEGQEQQVDKEALCMAWHGSPASSPRPPLPPLRSMQTHTHTHTDSGHRTNPQETLHKALRKPNTTTRDATAT